MAAEIATQEFISHHIHRLSVKVNMFCETILSAVEHFVPTRKSENKDFAFCYFYAEFMRRLRKLSIKKKKEKKMCKI